MFTSVGAITPASASSAPISTASLEWRSTSTQPPDIFSPNTTFTAAVMFIVLTSLSPEQ